MYSLDKTLRRFRGASRGPAALAWAALLTVWIPAHRGPAAAAAATIQGPSQRSDGSVVELGGPRALDLSRPVPFFIATGRPEDGVRPGDRELARWALDAWQRQIGSSLRLVPSPESSAILRVYWAGPTGGQYGEMRSVVVNGRRGAAVYIRPDTSSLGPDIAALAHADPLLRDAIVHLTCVHELGHAFGLEHTSDVRDIMYSFGYGGDIAEYFGRYRRQLRSRGDMAAASAMSEADIARVKALYGSR